MKISTLLTLPVASLGMLLVPQARAALNELPAEATRQALHYPSAMAVISLGGLLSICFFVQRSR